MKSRWQPGSAQPIPLVPTTCSIVSQVHSDALTPTAEETAYADHLRMVDGKVTFTATDEAFKKTAEFFNMLYEEGLIWNGSFEAD